jgi:predicted acylesterase/phospholipase RssA
MSNNAENDNRAGLALSGGGFRASFFHIGVLARLAEVGRLHEIEVISTVSGGSIVGVLYYLHVKRLLESKEDSEIKPEDYVQVVNRVEEEFFAGVENNIRTRTFGSLKENFNMFKKNYSRSDRIGELYESILYKPFIDTQKQRIYMRDLKILPKRFTESQEFVPGRYNRERINKVPILLLNATSLNTGHNWQFTASWMGEPPRGIPDIDKNMRLRRLYYHEAPNERLKNTPLGVAVAASAGVPGLFPPMAVSELYPDITVQLVDGGVHDNQGTEGLQDEKCTYIFCSDASGQMGDDNDPGEGALAVLPRSNSILMDRVREAELLGMKTRRDAKDLKGFNFVHLKRGLIKPDITWEKGQDKEGQVHMKDTGGVTDYGVDRNVQRLLSNIRTDLDSFSEVEAYSLILSGYLMTKEELKDVQSVTGACRFHNKKNFTVLERLIKDPSDEYTNQLKVAGSLFLKAFQLVPWLKGLGLLAISLAIIVLVMLLKAHLNDPIPGTEYLQTWKTLIVALVTLVAAIFIRQIPGIRWIYYSRIVRNILVHMWTATFGFLFAWFHLIVIDPIFKWQGRLKRLSK